MICPLCRYGHTRPGFASAMQERDSTSLLLKNATAKVWGNSDVDRNSRHRTG